MRATIVLMDEHRVIERVLSALEKALQRLERGEGVEAEFFLKAAEFSQGFADGCHHRKEEGALFPAMVSSGLPRESGPISVMLAEHEEGRRLTRAMRAAAERMGAGDPRAVGDVMTHAAAYAALLRSHIAKEDGVLFPMADQVIVPAEAARLETAFERIEKEETGEGVHDKALDLASDLERLAGA